MSLNPKQKLAVTCDDHCLVVACPGSGKSRVVVEKVKYVLTNDPSARIIVVTFSREGANELKHRLSEPPNEHEPPILNEYQIKQVYISTFHSLALNHLKRERISVRIAKSSDTANYLQRAMAYIGANISEEEAAKKLQKCKTTMNYQPDKSIDGMLYSEYQRLCKVNNVVDFYDIMNMSLNMMMKGSLPILNATHMFVDEFQDSDEIQYQYMMCHLRGNIKVTAVGDDDQAIYAFRNSLGYEGMRRFESEADVTRIVLDTNYRCKREILTAADKLIQHNANRMDKRLFAERGLGGKVEVHPCGSSEKECELVCEHIQNELAGRQPRIGEWAVLARNNQLLEIIYTDLNTKGIPCTKTFKSIWEKQPVTMYLTLLESGTSKNVVNAEHILHWIGIEEEDLNNLNILLKGNFSNIFDRKKNINISFNGLSDSGIKILQSFIKDYNGWAKGLKRTDAELINLVIETIGSWMISKTKNKREVERLSIAMKYLTQVRGTITERIRFLTTPAEKSEDGGSVSLITMHSSKGLEFDNVWIIAADDKVIPSDPDDIYSERTLAEERRLMYVAMTRAKNNLHISYTSKNGSSVYLKESKLIT